MGFELILFYAFAAIAVGTTLLVVVQSNPVYSVLLLIGSFIGLAGLYVLLQAPFVAVIQIIVYAGAIMVLFLFVVMLLNAPREELVTSRIFETPATRAIGAMLAIAFAVELAWALNRSRTLAWTVADDTRRPFSVPEIGQRLFQEYAFAFEATSILILVAMIGAITLAGRHVTEGARLKSRLAGDASARTEAQLTLRPTADASGDAPRTDGGVVEGGRAQL